MAREPIELTKKKAEARAKAVATIHKRYRPELNDEIQKEMAKIGIVWRPRPDAADRKANAAAAKQQRAIKRAAKILKDAGVPLSSIAAGAGAVAGMGQATAAAVEAESAIGPGIDATSPVVELSEDDQRALAAVGSREEWEAHKRARQELSVPVSDAEVERIVSSMGDPELVERVRDQIADAAVSGDLPEIDPDLAGEIEMTDANEAVIDDALANKATRSGAAPGLRAVKDAPQA